jgi:hypothetical protein
MDIDEAGLLREVRRGLEAVAGQGQEAQAAAVRAVLDRYGASFDDLARAVARVKQRHARELAGLSRRIERLAEQREDAAATADAVDAFVRSLGRGG